MKKFTSAGLLAACVAALLASASVAEATVLFTTPPSTFPATGTSTQVGRLVRNGVPQDFSGTETYPGTNNPGITFNYITFTLTPDQLAGGPYVQVNLDSDGLGLFASAYLNSYNPAASFQTNWLGDAGGSGNPFPGDPRSFGVTVPVGSSLVIVLSTAGAANGNVGTGIGTPYTLEVEYFSSTTYDPVAAVPEPSTWAMLGLGVVGVSAVVLRRRQRV